MSTVLFIKAAMPVPDPPPVTEIRTSGFTFWYSSAQASARLTIVSEPLFSMYFEEDGRLESVDVSVSPHPMSNIVISTIMKYWRILILMIIALNKYSDKVEIIQEYLFKILAISSRI